MNTRSPAFDMFRQPSANAADLRNAVVTWHRGPDGSMILSKYPDDIWIGPPLGSLAAVPFASRIIDLTRHPAAWRESVRAALYASQRHPLRISVTPSFATLMKRNQGFAALAQYCSSLGIGPQELDAAHTMRFLEERTKAVAHLETLVSVVACLRGAAIHHAQGLLEFDAKYPFPLAKGAKAASKALWREVHGKDFEGGGDAPFDDDDLTLVVSNAHLYVEELALDIIDALTECLDIAEAYPNRRSDRSQEGLCMRAQKRFLASCKWRRTESQICEWPPTTLQQVLAHARMCSAASAITISFATGSRRGEINSLKDGCLSKDANGFDLLKLMHFKGRDELNGKEVTLPVDRKVVAAISVQSKVKEQIRRYMHEDTESGLYYTDHLFVQLGRHTEGDAEYELRDDPGLPYTLAGGRLSANGLAGQLRAFKDRVVPSVDGTVSFTRFRKSVAKLVTLSMEGAPLVLQIIFGHSNYRTTLGYMFASPMITEEIAESYPELMANNLRKLYRERDTLLGGGAKSIRSAARRETSAAMLTEPEIGMSEDEFVQLGLDMMQSGQMILSLLGPGMYCLKPLLARGPCNDDPAVLLPNIGRCTPTCGHHVISASQRPKLVRQVHWLAKKLADPQTSAPMRQFYSRYEKELTFVLEGT